MNCRRIPPVLFSILSLALITTGCATEPEKSEYEEFIEYVNRIEAAADKVIGDEMQKQTETLVIPVTWEDEDGNDVIYRIIQTTYYNEDSPRGDDLNVDVIKEIIEDGWKPTSDLPVWKWIELEMTQDRDEKQEENDDLMMQTLLEMNNGNLPQQDYSRLSPKVREKYKNELQKIGKYETD